MSEGARVQSIDAIKEFRVRMAKFGESAGLALGEADSDIGKTLTWLEGEQQTFWNGQIRKCQEEVAKAEDAYRYKKLYKDSTGSTPSAVEELKALNLAKKKLAYALERLANTKSWVRKLQKEMTLYRGGVARFSNAVSSGVPMAIAQLGSVVVMLEKYTDISLEAAAAGMEGSAAGGLGSDQTGPSMARPADEAPAPLLELDPKILRGLIPSAETLAEAKKGQLDLKPIAIPPEQHPLVEVLGSAPTITPDDRVVIASGTKESARTLITRIVDPAGPGAMWYIAPVDATGVKEHHIINLATLLEGQPDLRPLLSLPAGVLAVIDFSGMAAIYNDKDENLWKPPAVESAEAAPSHS